MRYELSPFCKTDIYFFLSQYTSQCLVSLVPIHLFGVGVWTDGPCEFAGALSRDLHFDGLPTSQSIGLRQNINPSAAFVVNCTNVSCFLFEMDNSVAYLLNKSHALTLHIFAQCTKTLIYHLFVFIGALYKAINISTKSTPPIAELYSLIASWHGTCKYPSFDCSRWFCCRICWYYLDTFIIIPLDYCETSVHITFTQYTTTTVFFLKSFSDSKGQPAILLALMVTVVKKHIDFSSSISFNV